MNTEFLLESDAVNLKIDFFSRLKFLHLASLDTVAYFTNCFLLTAYYSIKSRMFDTRIKTLRKEPP